MTAPGQPKPGSIDETIAMVDSISRQVIVGENIFNVISFRELVFPAFEGQSDYHTKKESYDAFFNRLKAYAPAKYGNTINVDYTIIHKKGAKGYLLVGNSPFLPGENPDYVFTYYLDGLQSNKPNGSPNFMLTYNGNSNGSASGLLNRKIDPAEKLELNPIADEGRFKANQEYRTLLQWARQLFKDATGEMGRGQK